MNVSALVILSTFGFTVNAGQPAGEPEPLVIKEQGSFFVNGEVIATTHSRGKQENTPLGHIVVNQMYVRYQIPQEMRTNALPIILMHGSGHTGKTFETTPDGRMGWAEYFLRQGFPVYVVDEVGRGRSGFNPSLVNQARLEDNASLLPPDGIRTYTLEDLWKVFRFGPEPMVWYDNTQFPKEAVYQYFAQAVPNTEAAFLVNPRESVDALAALLDKIGRSIILVHSMSGSYGMGAVVARPELVAALVNVEGRCQLSNGELEDPAKDFSKTVGGFSDAALLTVFGDIRDIAFWEQFRERCQKVVDAIKNNGGIAFNMDLPELGLMGNTHMMMLDKNNIEIANLILNWLEENVLEENVQD